VANLIDWSNKLSVSVDSIDVQHKKLIDLINELNASMAQGKSNEVMEHILNELINYTSYHFQHEETMMRKHNYPGYSAHKAEHDGLVKIAVDLQHEFNSGQTRISLGVMKYLKAWLHDHILGTDMKLGVYMSARDAA